MSPLMPTMSKRIRCPRKCGAPLAVTSLVYGVLNNAPVYECTHCHAYIYSDIMRYIRNYRGQYTPQDQYENLADIILGPEMPTQ